MSSNTASVSQAQPEEGSFASQRTPEEEKATLSRHEECPALPPLDIRAATSSMITETGQRKMSEWSMTSTAVEKLGEPIVMGDPRTGVERTSQDKENVDMEKQDTATQHVERSPGSLTPSTIKDRSISDVTLPLPDLPLSKQAASMSLVRKVALVVVACLAQFLNLGGMNQTVAPVMVLADYFHIVDYGTLSWFSAAYSMTVGTFILPAGKPRTLLHI